jgi:hypothetical protein
MSHKTARDGYSHDPSCKCSVHDAGNWKKIVAVGDQRVLGNVPDPPRYAWKPGSTVIFAFQAAFPRRQRQVLRWAIERWRDVLGGRLTMDIRRTTILVPTSSCRSCRSRPVMESATRAP